MADGKSYMVKHPDFVAIAGGHTIFLYTEGARFAWIDVRNVLRFESDAHELA